MNKRFEIVFLDEAFEFLKGLDRKHYEKILYNIRKVQVENDSELFKKLTQDIWEFRTLYQGLQYAHNILRKKIVKNENLHFRTGN